VREAGEPGEPKADTRRRDTITKGEIGPDVGERTPSALDSQQNRRFFLGFADGPDPTSALVWVEVTKVLDE
jgi:hypothetical protein